MKRVHFDEQAAGRFQGSLAGASGSLSGASGSPQSGRRVAHCSLVVFFFAVAHAAATSGSFTHASDRGAVARGVSAVGRASQRSEVDVRDAVIFAAGPVGALAMSVGVSAAELQVPSKQYPTIQSAIDVAVDGDVVVIAAGVFTESCVVQGKAIEIRGAGADQTTWVAPAASRCLWMPFLDMKAMVIADIHFTGFSMPYNAAAVDLESTGAHRVSHCKFTSCGYFPLEIFGGGSIVEDCEFVGNTGRGVSMTIPRGQSGGEQRIVRSRFIDNRNTFDFGSSAITIYNSQVRVEQCTFTRNNYPSGNGVAVEINTGVLTVTDTDFCDLPGTSVIAGSWIDGGGNSFSSSPCVPPCPGDLVDDDVVNAADLGILLNFWGTDGSGFPGVDLDGDGIVGAADLSTLLSNWGPCPE